MERGYGRLIRETQLASQNQIACESGRGASGATIGMLLREVDEMVVVLRVSQEGHKSKYG